MKSVINELKNKDEIFKAYIYLFKQNYMIDRFSEETEKLFDLISYRMYKDFEIDIENCSYRELFEILVD